MQDTIGCHSVAITQWSQVIEHIEQIYINTRSSMINRSGYVDNPLNSKKKTQQLG